MAPSATPRSLVEELAASSLGTTTHPGTAASIRAPTRAEVAVGPRFAEQLAPGRTVVAAGRVAQRALGVAHVRHPAHGGGKGFRAGLVELLDRGVPRQA